jgi:hypothetical protein
MSRQREIPELVYLLEAGASRAQVINYTLKILEWAELIVASTPRQSHGERHALQNATARLIGGRQELLDSVGLGYNPTPESQDGRVTADLGAGGQGDRPEGGVPPTTP